MLRSLGIHNSDSESSGLRQNPLRRQADEKIPYIIIHWFYVGPKRPAISIADEIKCVTFSYVATGGSFCKGSKFDFPSLHLSGALESIFCHSIDACIAVSRLVD